ncbi:hypothetical protein OsJ_11777 [Oryza sativa Japonica Group]|uniref:Uncharacterized protein n=1 Tax=Oryza sativa subsp. japonica TaxID=39947 RepID=B9F9S2_ORYSJ|nr:hypothetical protein OsJ_11777 [Oryza sativa Japonica Group]
MRGSTATGDWEGWTRSLPYGDDDNGPRQVQMPVAAMVSDDCAGSGSVGLQAVGDPVVGSSLSLDSAAGIELGWSS